MLERLARWYLRRQIVIAKGAAWNEGYQMGYRIGAMSDWHPIVRLKIDGRVVPEGEALRLGCISRMEDGSLVISFQTEKQKQPEIQSIA